MRRLYTLCFYLFVPVLLLKFYGRSWHQSGYRRRWLERFGFYPKKRDFSSKRSPCVHFHCVSVGETITAAPLIKAVMQQYSPLTLVITCSSITGSQSITQLFGQEVQHVYLPFDLPGPLRRFFSHFNPQLSVLLESELWPNFLAFARQQQRPVVLLNARLSEKSHQRYVRYPWLTHYLLQPLQQVGGQSAAQTKRFQHLGISPKKLHITGNLKCEQGTPAPLSAPILALKKQLQTRPSWIAGSTHAGEELSCLQAHQTLLTQHPNALLILAVRHPERFNAVAKLCQQQGFTLQHHSHKQALAEDTQVYLIDTLGELTQLYGIVDVAFIGGSLVQNIGGHNMMEAIARHTPILCGPYTSNFASCTEPLLACKGLQICHNPAELAELIQTLWQHPHQAQQQKQRAEKWLQQEQGATQRSINILTPYLQAASQHHLNTRSKPQMHYADVHH